MAEYDKKYIPEVWKDYPLTDTSINAYRLNHIEGGINENDNRIVSLSADKLDKDAAKKFVTSWKLDTKTWIATTTYVDGTVETADFPIEMMPTRIDLDSENNLVLVQQDGTTKKINFERFVYNVANTTTVAMQLEGTTISARILDGSITLSKLEPSLLSTIRQYMLDAQTAKGQAEQAAENARGWAIGGTGFEGVNAQHFANQAKRYAVITDEAPQDNAEYYAQDAAKSAEEARQAAGCDGTAASIKAVDVQGIVSAAGGDSNVQALINAVADQVINRLIGKNQIVNNLLATVPGNVLDATQGKALNDGLNQVISDLGDVSGKVDASLLSKTDYVTNTAVFDETWMNLYQMSNLKLFSAFGRVKAVIPHHTIITLATINGKYGCTGGGLCTETNDNFIKCHSWLVVSGSDILVRGYFEVDVPVGANMYFGGFWIN